MLDIKTRQYLWQIYCVRQESSDFQQWTHQLQRYLYVSLSLSNTQIPITTGNNLTSTDIGIMFIKMTLVLKKMIKTTVRARESDSYLLLQYSPQYTFGSCTFCAIHHMHASYIPGYFSRILQLLHFCIKTETKSWVKHNYRNSEYHFSS